MGSGWGLEICGFVLSNPSPDLQTTLDPGLPQKKKKRFQARQKTFL